VKKYNKCGFNTIEPKRTPLKLNKYQELVFSQFKNKTGVMVKKFPITAPKQDEFDENGGSALKPE
jgi:hypothetical protein